MVHQGAVITPLGKNESEEKKKVNYCCPRGGSRLCRRSDKKVSSGITSLDFKKGGVNLKREK